jgi:hypothetical protein
MDRQKTPLLNNKPIEAFFIADSPGDARLMQPVFRDFDAAIRRLLGRRWSPLKSTTRFAPAPKHYRQWDFAAERLAAVGRSASQAELRQGIEE